MFLDPDGFSAGVGYDQASGLGSVDAHSLVVSWTGSGGSVSRTTPAVTLSSSAGTISSTSSANLTVTVKSSNGGTPTGNVSFSAGGISLGSATLSGSGGSASAILTVSGARLQVGSDTIAVLYSGDNSYNSASASITITVNSSTSGGSPSISGVSNGASFRQSYAPGMVLSVFGSSLAPSTSSAGAVPLPLQMAGVSATINGIAAPLYYVSSSQLNIQIPYEVPANTNAQLIVTNNGVNASKIFAVAAAAPGIFTDSTGVLVPTNSAIPGQVIIMFITGQGAVSPSIATGAAPPSGTSVANLPAPMQGAKVSIGGINAPIQFIGIPPGLVGVTQINLVVPSGLARGVQPVIVTIGTIASVPATLTIQ